MLDAMIALSIFMSTFAWTVSELIVVYEERISIQQEEIAIELNHDFLQRWMDTNETPNRHMFKGTDDTLYEIDWTSTSMGIEICVQWEGANDRKRTICAEAH